MIKIYPLEWLDNLILQTLTPDNINTSSISNFDISSIREDVLKESKKIQVQIKNEVFAIRKKRQIRLLVRKYHSSFIYLMDIVVENKNSESFKSVEMSSIADLIIISLEGLLSFIEARFANFLSLDHRVPLTYIIVSRNELKLKIKKLESLNVVLESDRSTMIVIVNSLNNLLQSSNGYKTTYRHLLYQKELLRKIEEFDFIKEGIIIYTAFDQMLIEANFNSIAYVHSITERINDKLKKKQNLKDQMNMLLLFFKELSQFNSNEKLSFDPFQKNIKETLNNWFKHEINYINSSMELSGDVKSSENTTKIEEKHELIQNKIECILSSDQIGLILRASDESRILKAKSMNQVFKTIVPHLSTSQKKDLSYASMRSKSYSAEERDKEIAIKTLERIIKHIKEY